MNNENLINKMTLEEKAGICSGYDYWHTKGVSRLNIPSIMLSDGPHGLRRHPGDTKTKDKTTPLPATCFPLACLSACSWDRQLIYAMGNAIGEEAVNQNVAVVLGPGVNIKRSPLCGKNFEYFSEDPYLSGEIGASWINGVQSNNVGTSVKHFATNNQESFRMTSDSTVDERALREIYLNAFEKTVKQSNPWTIMSSYNKLNGKYCTENDWLLNKVLRDEWGFKGIVVCDWGAENNRVDGLKSGNDLEMPSSNGIGDSAVVNAIKSNELKEDELNACVDRMLDLALKSNIYNNNSVSITNSEEHHQLAHKIAGESMVLLKNSDNILPLDINRNIAIIGDMAKNPRYQGSGSSQVNPIKIDNFYDEAKKINSNLLYAKGYDKSTDDTENRMIDEAKEVAKKAEIVLLFVGLTEQYEAEANDRTHLQLPANQADLINEICNVNDNVVIVLSGGAPIEMPWINKVKAVLNTYLSGQAGAGAILDIITGKVNPSGKLAEYYPLNLEDVPCSEYYPNRFAPYYKESIYVGYRYYDTVGKEVLFPFGYGLSYTKFVYENLIINIDAENKKVLVSFEITNVGNRDGAEVAQVYVQANNSLTYRPKKELKGFEKIFLKAGEKKTVTVELNRRAFSFYNVYVNDWQVENCGYCVLVGSSSADILLSSSIKLPFYDDYIIKDYHEDAPSYYIADVKNVSDTEFGVIYGKTLPRQGNDPNKPLDFNSTFSDAKDIPAVRVLKKVIRIAVSKTAPNELQANVAYNSIMAVPIRTIISMSQGFVTEEIAQGIVDILDGKGVAKPLFHIVKGLTKSIKYLPNLLNTVS